MDDDVKKQAAQKIEANESAADKELLHKLVKQVDEHPENYQNYYDLAACLVQMHSYEQAEELLMKALGLFADKDKKAKDLLTYGLGNVYYSAGEYEKAITEFQKVTDSELKADAYLMMAQSFMGQKNYKKALAFLLTAQESAKSDPEIDRMIGQCLMALGNNKQAADFYDKVLEKLPKDGKANFDRGLLAMVQGEDFKPFFDKAEKYDKANFDAKQNQLAEIEKAIQAGKEPKQDK